MITLEEVEVSSQIGETLVTKKVLTKAMERKVFTVDTSLLVDQITIGSRITTLTTELEAPISTKGRVALQVRPKVERTLLEGGKASKIANMGTGELKAMTMRKLQIFRMI